MSTEKEKKLYFPQITGEYAVGSFLTSFVEDGRKEKIGPNAENEMRKHTIRVFFPVEKASVEGKKKAVLISREAMKAMGKEYKLKVDYDKITDAGENESNFYENITPMPDKKFPLVLFSHGYKSYIEGNSFLCCEIASRGYVVISIGHRYEAMALTGEDGRTDYFYTPLMKKSVSPFLPGFLAMFGLQKKKGTPEECYDAFVKVKNKYCSFMEERMYEWVSDTVFVLKKAKELYGDFIDFSKGVAAGGHSMGGAVAYNLCQRYPDDFACGINIDGGLFGNYEGMTMTKPFFQICSKGNYSVETKPMLGKTEPAYYATFFDTPHIAFADVKFVIRNPLATGKIPAQVLHENLCKCHVDFLDQYLKQKSVETFIPNSQYIRFEKF